MGFLKGTNTFEIGKLKLGSTNIDRLYLGSNYVWPPIPSTSCTIEATAIAANYFASCAIEGIAQTNVPLFSCAIEGVVIANVPLFSCAIEGSAVYNNTI